MLRRRMTRMILKMRWRITMSCGRWGGGWWRQGEEDDDVEEEDVEEEDHARSGTHTIYRTNAVPRIEPRTRTHTLREPAQSRCMPTCLKSYGNLQMPQTRMSQERGHTHFVRGGAVKIQVNISTEPLYTEMPQTRMSPERRQTLCASLRSRNARQHVIRATSIHFIWKFARKMPAGAPWSSTGLYTYRNGPSVWTHCLGNESLWNHPPDLDCWAQMRPEKAGEAPKSRLSRCA